MSHVLLIRHGQTDANAAGVIQGQLPTSLNNLGRAQALCVARALQARRPPVTRLLSSPLPRAVETAQLIGQTLGLSTGIDDRWAERHFGSLQGQPSDVRRVMTHGGVSGETDDAEPKAVFDRRVAEALQELGVPGDEVTAVVSHGGVIGSVVRQLMSGALPCVNPPPERRPVPNGSIFHLEWTPSAWVVRAYFDVGHLGTLVSVLDAG
ncbi:MAG: histidine phosphatase family protein [Tepidisphaerales bacterium]